MGKSKQRRLKNRSANPIGIPSLKEMEECEELACENVLTGTVESIIEKLQSRSPDDKECAAFTIANMASNPGFVTSMIVNKVIRVAGPLLLDRNPAVRHAIAGSLRNVAACGDFSVSQAMVEQDIMTSLATLLLEYKNPWSPVKSPENKIDSKSEIFLEACNLLWSLCESSDTAVAIFNKKKLIFVLLPCLNIDVYGLQIPLAVAQCLHTVGEENPEVMGDLCNPLVQEQLKAMMALKPVEPEHVLLKTLAAGIILNMNPGKIHNCMSDITNPLFEVIASTLSEPINPSLVHFTERIASHKQEKSNKYHDENDLADKLNAVDKSFKIVDHLLQAKQIALEILTNTCFGDDSNDEWDDMSSSDNSEEMEMEVEASMTPALKLGLGIPSEIHGIIVNWKLLEKVVEQIVVPTEEILNTILENSDGADVLKRLSTVRCRALLCLSNMVQGLEIENLGGPDKLFDLWMNIANLLFKQTGFSYSGHQCGDISTCWETNPNDDFFHVSLPVYSWQILVKDDISNTEQLEAATSSMRAVLQKLAEANCSSQFRNMSESDLELLINICNQSQDGGVRVNIIRSLGTIGCLLGNPQLLQSSYKLIHIIGIFLLEICSKCLDLWVTAEALDVIFDVFAEDHLDPVAQQISLVEKLTHLLPFLKGKVKQQRKSLGEHLPVIMTAKTNLIRFIKYKNDHNKK